MGPGAVRTGMAGGEIVRLPTPTHQVLADLETKTCLPNAQACKPHRPHQIFRPYVVSNMGGMIFNFTMQNNDWI